MPTFREDPKLGSKVPMIKTADLNEQCVTNSKILDGCITKEKLAKGTVDATTLANKSVGTEKLSDSSVTNEKISNKAVSTEKLADGSITKEKIFNASITTEKLANESVSAEKLQSGLRNTIASTYDKTIELDNQKANIADVGNAIERLENKIGERILVEGDVTNLPDEEDLTSVSTIDGREVMKLNDRAYEPSNFSGKGYKILRKNIKKFDIPTVSIVVSYAPTSSGDITITVNDKVTTINLDSTTDTTPAIVATKIAAALKSSLDNYNVSLSSNRIALTRHNDSSVSPSSINVGNTSAVISVTDSITKNVHKNVLTADMIDKPNTIYEIKYDFDLNEKEITIPEGCSLKFTGGSFINGTIIGNNTIIKASLVKIFGLYISIEGSWDVIEAYPEWFGAKGNGKDDDFKAFYNVIKSFNKIKVSGKTYLIDCLNNDKVFYVNKYINIKGDVNSILQFKNIKEGSIIFHIDFRGFLMENIKCTNTDKNKTGVCIYHLRTYNSKDDKYWSTASNMTLINCTFEYFNTGIKALSYTNEYKSCRCEHCNTGFYVGCIENRPSTVTNNYFDHCHSSYNNIAYNINYCIYSVFNNCTSDFNDLVFKLDNCASINFIGCGTEANKKLLNAKLSNIITFIGCNFLTPCEGLIESAKDTVFLDISDTITFTYCFFNFYKKYEDIKNTIPVLFTMNRAKYVSKAIVILKDCQLGFSGATNDYVSALFDNNAKNKVIVTSVRGIYISEFGSVSLPPLDESMKNVTGIEVYNRKTGQKNYFFEDRWIDPEGYTVTDNRAGLSASRPTSLKSIDSVSNRDTGYCFYDLSLKQPIYWTGTRWRNVLGVEITDAISATIGSKDVRLNQKMEKHKHYGFLFFDTTLSTYVCWNGTMWTTLEGNPADSLKKGTTAQRPTSVQVGFIYKDTDLNKWIIWNGNSWENLDGSSL